MLRRCGSKCSVGMPSICVCGKEIEWLWLWLWLCVCALTDSRCETRARDRQRARDREREGWKESIIYTVYYFSLLRDGRRVSWPQMAQMEGECYLHSILLQFTRRTTSKEEMEVEYNIHRWKESIIYKVRNFSLLVELPVY